MSYYSENYESEYESDSELIDELYKVHYEQNVVFVDDILPKTDPLDSLEVIAVDEDWECPICYQKNDSDVVAVCNNKHLFHKKCFKKWVNINKQPCACPICRSSIVLASCHISIAEHLTDEQIDRIDRENRVKPIFKERSLIDILLYIQRNPTQERFFKLLVKWNIIFSSDLFTRFLDLLVNDTIPLNICVDFIGAQIHQTPRDPTVNKRKKEQNMKLWKLVKGRFERQKEEEIREAIRESSSNNKYLDSNFWKICHIFYLDISAILNEFLDTHFIPVLNILYLLQGMMVKYGFGLGVYSSENLLRRRLFEIKEKTEDKKLKIQIQNALFPSSFRIT